METLFFWLSKLLWFLISPLNFVLLLLLSVWLLFKFGMIRLAKPVLGSIVLILMLIAIFPIGEWLLYPLENRFRTNPDLPESIEGIIVLAGALNAEKSIQWKQVQVTGSVERELAFIKLSKTYPDATLVYTGGSSSLLYQQYKQADVAKQLFEEQGLDTSRIIFERESRNTIGNASRSLQLVKPKFNNTWILITSAFHMPRSIGVFCSEGWPTLPFPVDHQTYPGRLFRIEFELAEHLNVLSLAIHEWLGLMAYRLTGKTSSILPNHCD